MTNVEVTVERLNRYTPEDARGIGRLMPFLSEHASGEPIPEELLQQIITSPHHEQLVARLDSIIVGAATLNMLMGPAVRKQGYLEDFVTDPQVRGKGIGNRIWDEMMKWCDENSVDLTFTSHAGREAAHRFYLSHGARIRDTTVFLVPRDHQN